MSKYVIEFGKWKGKPIEWIVLKRESLGTMVISKIALFSCPFNRNQSDGNIWEGSLLRKYLNGDFFNTAFSEPEKKKIINAYLPEPYQTKDNVFVLSVEEADSLMTQNERATGSMQWTRTPNSNHTIYAWRIGPDGGFDEAGHYFGCVSASFDIRPAMYIKE